MFFFLVQMANQPPNSGEYAELSTVEIFESYSVVNNVVQQHHFGQFKYIFNEINRAYI